MSAAEILTGNQPTTNDLRAAVNRERWHQLLLITPALALIFCLLVAPFIWLVWLSLLDSTGQFSFVNYMQLSTQPAVLKTFATTFRVSLIVTLLSALLGYPLAYLLALMPRKIAAICLLAVILPFWTSILVRTYAWMVLLARRGIVNQTLQGFGVTSEPIALMHNQVGTVIGMTHIMLPFLILPLYTSMLSIDRAYVRAGASLGASPLSVFWRIFFPLSLPGLAAGLCFVFVLCLGFYITPALLGGGRVQMIAMIIERTVTFNASWGPAGALGVILLAATLVVLALAYLLGRKRWGR